MHTYFNYRKMLLSYKKGNKSIVENSVLHAYIGCNSLLEKFKNDEKNEI